MDILTSLYILFGITCGLCMFDIIVKYFYHVWGTYGHSPTIISLALVSNYTAMVVLLCRLIMTP